MKTKSLTQKVIVCLLTGLVCGETFFRIGDKFLSVIIPVPVITGISAALLLGGLVGGFVWHNQEKKGNDSMRTNAFWIGALRYGIAFDLAMFGFQKIFHQQFITPLGMLDEPFSSLSKQWLTWSYFGRSYEFIVTIALTQIVGASLLVFNRTRLLGTIVLIPVMLNIIFIDYFYELDLPVLIHALTLLAGLIQLLLVDYKRLVDFFFKDKSIEDLSVSLSRVVKYAGRLSIIVVPLLLIATYASPNRHPDLKGKYQAIDMTVNGKPAAPATCADSLLTVVYLDLANECVFEFNSLKRRFFGKYQLDSAGLINVEWRFPPAARDKKFTGVLTKQENNSIELDGIMNGDSIRVLLQKQ